MALLGNNITPRLANTEMGNPYGASPNDLTVKEVCENSGQNQFSFYGPWHLDTDVNGNCEIDYGVDSYRLGDFRLYNHSKTSTGTPKPQDDYDQAWGPGGSTVDFELSSFPYNMNILEALNNSYSTTSLRLCFKLYTSAAARITGTSPIQTIYSTLSWGTLSGASLMANHIRNQTSKASSTQLVTLTGVSTAYSVLYMDTYISDISGNRLVNLGTSIAGGYTDITFVENVYPYFQGSFVTLNSPPVTGAHVAISSANPVCNDDTPVDVSVGTSWSIYTKLKGQSGIYQQLVAATGVSIRFRHYNSVGTLLETDTRTSQTFTNSASKQFTGTWSDNMSYGNYIIVDITAVTWGSVGTTNCP